MDYRYGSHTVFKIQYHFVLVTKYRYKVLKGDVDSKALKEYRKRNVSGAAYDDPRV
ncbi:transposase, partial [Methylobacter sp.]|uniref:transposase n=1 Tax=Methylobacter sp. TaxID=2051955 RepID=UPI002FDCBA24